MDAGEAIRLINQTRHIWLPAADALLLWWLAATIRGLFRGWR